MQPGPARSRTKILSGLIGQLLAAEKKLDGLRDAAFTKLTTEFFGDRKEAILANGKGYLAANLRRSSMGCFLGWGRKS
jgi:hypothetical protein